MSQCPRGYVIVKYFGGYRCVRGRSSVTSTYVYVRSWRSLIRLRKIIGHVSSHAKGGRRCSQLMVVAPVCQCLDRSATRRFCGCALKLALKQVLQYLGIARRVHPVLSFPLTKAGLPVSIRESGRRGFTAELGQRFFSWLGSAPEARFSQPVLFLCWLFLFDMSWLELFGSSIFQLRGWGGCCGRRSDLGRFVDGYTYRNASHGCIDPFCTYVR